MKIGDFYLDNTAFGVMAFVVSALSAWFTYHTNRAMLQETRKTADANSRMADANEATLEENRRMSDANEQMVELTRRAAQVAEGETQRQSQERTEANKARFVFRDGTRRGDGYEAHLVNRGNHRAEHPRATVHWAEKEIGHGEEKERVDPDDDVQIAFWVRHMVDALPENRIVTVRLSYADGNGPHEKEWQIRYSDGNDITSWRPDVISEPEF